MKKLLLLLLFFVSLTGYSQKTIQKEKKPRLIINDSMVDKLKHFKDSMMQVEQSQMDSVETRNNINNNVDYLVQLQKEQKAKQKKAAMIRIGIGVALFIVLIIGLMRMRRKKS